MSRALGVGRRLTAAIVGLTLAIGGASCTGGPGDDAEPAPSRSVRPKPPTADERAETLLTGALDRLAVSPVVHYKGRYNAPTGATDVDLRISSSGVAYGTMSDAGTKLRILTLQDQTFIRGNAAFWSSSASAAGVDPKLKSQLIKRYAASWVSAEAKDIGDPASTLRPVELARQFGQQVRKVGVSNVRAGKLGGKPVSVISVGFTNYYVGSASPNQLLAVEKPRIEAADRATRGALRDPGDDNDDAPDDDSLEFDELDPPAVDDFYDGVQNEAKRNLPKAIDSRVNFNTTLAGAINCPFGSGQCTVTANVSNTVSAGDSTVAAGTVLADMTVFATGPSNSATCTDSKSMPINSSTTMACVAGLVLPVCNKRGGICTWPVTANIMVLARANINVSKLLKDIGGERSKAKDQVQCQLSRSCEPAVIDDSMQGIRASEQATAKRLADRPEFAGRTFRKPKTGDADWEDDLGRTYDALGDGTKSKYFRFDQFKASLDHHLTKSYDYTILDMTGYTPGQIGLVKAYLSALPERITSRMITRLITIGM